MADALHCPHGCAPPCSSCEGSALARELRALRILRDAAQNLEQRCRSVKTTHAEVERESWFALLRALAYANTVTS